MKLRFTKGAVRQIEEIIDAIAQESPQGARRVRERMQSITALLIEHPHIGQQTDVAGIRRINDLPAELSDAAVMDWFSRKRRAVTGNDANPFREALAKYFAGAEDPGTRALLTSAS